MMGGVQTSSSVGKKGIASLPTVSYYHPHSIARVFFGRLILGYISCRQIYFLDIFCDPAHL